MVPLVISIATTLGLNGFVLLAEPAQIDRPSCVLGPSKSTGWDLAKIFDQTQYSAAAFADHTGFRPEQILGDIADEYAEASYSPEEFSEVISGLMELVSRTEPKERELSDLTEDISCGNGVEPKNRHDLIIYIDVTCSHCRELVEWIHSAHEICGNSIPSLAYRLMPSSEELAVDAAAYLDIIKRRTPNQFCVSVNSFLTLLPDGGATLSILWADYRAQFPSEVLQADLDAARARIKDKAKQFPSSTYGAPVLVYRGRILGRRRAFNALSSVRTLVQTLLLIDLWDGGGRKDGGS